MKLIKNVQLWNFNTECEKHKLANDLIDAREENCIPLYDKIQNWKNICHTYAYARVNIETVNKNKPSIIIDMRNGTKENNITKFEASP